MSISKKPWNSRDFGNSRAAFAQHFLDTFGPESPEFKALVPDLASDLCLPEDTPAEELHESLQNFKALFTEELHESLQNFKALFTEHDVPGLDLRKG